MLGDTLAFSRQCDRDRAGTQFGDTPNARVWLPQRLPPSMARRYITAIAARQAALRDCLLIYRAPKGDTVAARIPRGSRSSYAALINTAKIVLRSLLL